MFVNVIKHVIIHVLFHDKQVLDSLLLIYRLLDVCVQLYNRLLIGSFTRGGGEYIVSE